MDKLANSVITALVLLIIALLGQITTAVINLRQDLGWWIVQRII